MTVEERREVSEAVRLARALAAAERKIEALEARLVSAERRARFVDSEKKIARSSRVLMAVAAQRRAERRAEKAEADARFLHGYMLAAGMDPDAILAARYS